MVEKMEVQEIKDMVLIAVDKGEVQRPAYTFMLQDIVSLFVEKNFLKDLPMLREKLYSKERLNQAIQVIAKRIVLLLILCHN